MVVGSGGDGGEGYASVYGHVGNICDRGGNGSGATGVVGGNTVYVFGGLDEWW